MEKNFEMLLQRMETLGRGSGEETSSERTATDKGKKPLEAKSVQMPKNNQKTDLVSEKG